MAVTAVVAVLLILLCMCFLFDWIPISKGGTTTTETNTNTTIIVAPKPDATPNQPRPSVDDLKGSSDKLVYPKEESYMDEYLTYSIQPESGQKTYLLFKPEPLKFTSDRIMDLEKDTIVTGIAKENGFTLVKVQEGVVGWVPTQELQAH